jgi:hypothetical protein
LVGLFINQNTGVLTITATNIDENFGYVSQNCRICIQVMLKKAGWKNTPLLVTSTELENLLI